MSNHYETLSIEPSATQAQIKQAYLAKAKSTHPDRFTDPEEKAVAHEQFTAVGAAFQVLSDPTLRSAYDASLTQSSLAPYQPSPPPASSAFTRPRAASHAPPSAPRAYTGSALSPLSSGYDPDQNWGSASFPQPSYGSNAHPFGPTSPTAFGGDGYAQPQQQGPPQGWQDPPQQNPFDLFLNTLQSMNQLTTTGYNDGGYGAGSGFGAGGGGGFGRRPSRVGQQDLPELITGMIGGQQVGLEGGRGSGGGGGGWDSPLTPPSSQEGWGSPPAGMGANPWGRAFSGNMSPGGRRGRGRSIQAKLNEGERHRNGDFHIRNQALEMHQLEDGSISWNSSSVEMEYTSGNEYGYPPTPPSSQPSPNLNSSWNATGYPPLSPPVGAPLARAPSTLSRPSLTAPPSTIGRPPSPGFQQRSLTAPTAAHADPRLAGLVRGGSRTPARRSTSPGPGLGATPSRLALTQGGEVGMGKPLGAAQSMSLVGRSQAGLPTRRLSAGAGAGGRPMLPGYSSSPAGVGDGKALVLAGGGRPKVGMGWH